MSHVKMLYGVLSCSLAEQGVEDTEASLNGGLDCNDIYTCEGCQRYEQERMQDDDGRAVFGGPCKWSEYREVCEERQMKRFTAYEQVNDGYSCPWSYPFILETSKRSYPCVFLEIDGHVYCDAREKVGA